MLNKNITHEILRQQRQRFLDCVIYSCSFTRMESTPHHMTRQAGTTRSPIRCVPLAMTRMNPVDCQYVFALAICGYETDGQNNIRAAVVMPSTWAENSESSGTVIQSHIIISHCHLPTPKSLLCFPLWPADTCLSQVAGLDSNSSGASPNLDICSNNFFKSRAI